MFMMISKVLVSTRTVVSAAGALCAGLAAAGFETGAFGATGSELALGAGVETGVGAGAGVGATVATGLGAGVGAAL